MPSTDTIGGSRLSMCGGSGDAGRDNLKGPSLPGRLDGVQILRGLAAILVTWHHALETSKGIGYRIPPPDWLILSGAAGVDVFFVISGFIMVYIVARKGGETGLIASVQFIKNRVLRIYPLYWTCCCVVLVAMCFGYFQGKSLSAADVASSLALWPSESRIIGISWTLSYEIYFYAIFATCLLARNLWRATISASVVIFVIMMLSRAFLAEGSFTSSPIVLEFVFGMVVSMAYLRFEGRLRLPRPLLLFGASVAGLISASILFLGDTTHHLPDRTRYLAWGLPSVLLLLAALRMETRLSFARRVGQVIGDASYAIYLFHPLVLTVYAKTFEKFGMLASVSQWVWVPLLTATCVSVGYFLHITLERWLAMAFVPSRPSYIAGVST